MLIALASVWIHSTYAEGGDQIRKFIQSLDNPKHTQMAKKHLIKLGKKSYSASTKRGKKKS